MTNLIDQQITEEYLKNRAKEERIMKASYQEAHKAGGYVDGKLPATVTKAQNLLLEQLDWFSL